MARYQTSQTDIFRHCSRRIHPLNQHDQGIFNNESSPKTWTQVEIDLLKTTNPVAFSNQHHLGADDEAVKNSRLLLCDLTACIMDQGLALLGIQTCEQM